MPAASDQFPGGASRSSCWRDACAQGQTVPQTTQKPPPLECAKRAEFEVPWVGIGARPATDRELGMVLTEDFVDCTSLSNHR